MPDLDGSRAREALRKLNETVPMVEGIEAARMRLSFELSEEARELLESLPSEWFRPMKWRDDPEGRWFMVYPLACNWNLPSVTVGFAWLGNQSWYVEFLDIETEGEDQVVGSHGRLTINLPLVLGIRATRDLIERIRVDLSKLQNTPA